MKWSIVITLVLAIALIGAIGSRAAAAPVAAVQYQFIDLGTLGGSISFYSGMNDRGQILGLSQTDGNEAYHTFLWENGEMRDLDPIRANDINNLGQMVATLQVGVDSDGWPIFHAFLWDNEKWVDLGALSAEGSEAIALNDRAEVIGVSPEPEEGFWSAFLWTKGEMINLVPHQPGRDYQDSRPFAINHRGVVVGETCDGSCAWVWSKGKLTYLRGEEGYTPHVLDINDKGLAVGQEYSYSSDRTLAVQWRGKKLARLLTPKGTNSEAHGVNNKSQIIGTIWIWGDPNYSKVISKNVLWDKGEIVPIITPNGYQSSGVIDINDMGWIVGEAVTTGGATHVVLWMPVKNR